MWPEYEFRARVSGPAVDALVLGRAFSDTRKVEIWWRLPYPFRIAGIGLAWFAYAVVVLDRHTPESSDLIAPYLIASCAGAAALSIVADVHAHRTVGSAERFASYRRALRTGAPASGADAEEWRKMLCGSQARLLLAMVLLSLFGWFAVMSTAFAAPLLLIAYAVGAWRLAQTKALAYQLPPTRVATPLEATFPGPLAVRLVGGVVAWFAIAFVILGIAAGPWLLRDGFQPVALAWIAGWAAAVAAVWVVLCEEWELSRDFAVVDEYCEYDRAVRSGVLPGDADVELWRRRLTVSRRSNLFRLFVALVVLVAGVKLALGDAVWQWAVAALYELLAVWVFLMWWVLHLRLMVMDARIVARATIL